MMLSTNYCKPENFRPRVIFAPFTLNVSGRIKDCANSIVSDHLFFSKHNLALANLRRGESRIKGENYMRRK